MKNFKDFKAEQKYTTEIIQYGPIGATIAAAAGIFGSYLAIKKGLEKYKGYRESKAEKKAREQNGFDMTVKVYNPATGKEEDQDFWIHPKDGNADLEKLGYKLPRNAAGRIKAPDDDQLDKMEKEAKKKSSMKTGEIKRKQAQGSLTDDDLTTDQQIQLGDKKKEDDKKAASKAADDREREEKSETDWVDHPDTSEIPSDMKSGVKEKERKKIAGHKDVLAYKKRWEMEPGASVDGWKKWIEDPDKPKDFEYVSAADYDKKMQQKQNKKPAKKEESKMLSFGEFISEDIMKDLKKITKSKRDMEIKLDDGSSIPIDPMTAEIFVKYIEGLKSSEQKRIINQIQRTERGFMKVLGKAHGE